MAKTDGLSGLLNKEAARTEIASRLKHRPNGQCDALFIIDVDNFKSINDTLGHIEGDRTLRMFAQCLKNTFRESDIVARFGGDEFIVYMEKIESPGILESKASLILEQTNNIIVGNLGAMRCSIGVAAIHEGRPGFEAVFKRADEALYRSKGEGKDRFTLS